ncbi:carbon-nitrogen family hydrolase [Lysinibacillus pakistanensis]|uniref:Carbon-nitrogen family hydrolase n=1 Tax=Lysinibacillus pakistanensis TaxID=759811 RepID=A0AAX3WWB5_9BACI|nr:carbon-nitrogen family hydrolase [Lysinibacillus pakistanensis]MDM5231622.1 carbon-nitrogen family hydrolase [Lysinibacillus pakistanensis]WHY47165.1 carbon-nitrogen family hydrolase [Lysinibacillus pakistanensis]WHY52175.1 carbon-nitrogen family hydrolase [Lysinibacillus pakistanensis]
MKIGCIQLNVGFGKVDENFARAEEKIRETANRGAEIIVLPEMWNTGYALERLPELADEDGVRTKAFLASLAKELSLHIVGGSVATKKGDKFYNTMYTFNKNGELVGEYSKAHLFRLMDEHLYLEAGDEMNRFTLGDIEAAGVICYDIRFPEWLRAHALEGAKVLFVPAQWPTPRIDHWKTLLQARAIENQCFVIAVNRISKKVENFNGQSMIIQPWGEVLWVGADDEEVAVIDVDFSIVDEVRGRIPVYDDRRPGLYSGVTVNN